MSIPKGAIILFGLLLGFVASQMLLLALHLESSSFPKPLSKADEAQAFSEYKNGDIKAYEKLISHNLRLVAHIVKKYYAGVTDQEDLLSIGTIGLIKAVKSFDIERKARFSTYAARCIENEILMVFRSSKKNQGVLSLTDCIKSDSEEGTAGIIDMIDDGVRVDEVYEKQEEVVLLRACIDRVLTAQERQIILMRYGLTTQIPQTQQEIADILNISRSYVSRIESKAVSKLKQEMCPK